MRGVIEIALLLVLVMAIVFGGLVLVFGPLLWTVHRVLRPVDRAARERNLPFRFSLGDFLCLFWVVQMPLSIVHVLADGEMDQFYWVLTIAVWAAAPLAWVTVARALSKAGVSAGLHRMIFLGIVLPTVYYGLFPFMGMSIAMVVGFVDQGFRFLAELRFISLWFILGLSLLACGFYSPWMVRQAAADSFGQAGNSAGLNRANSGIGTHD